MAQSYQVLVSNEQFEVVEKRSRFIAAAMKVDSREDVDLRIRRLRQMHPKANHVCYAFLAGAPNDAQLCGFSDDGEPSGTAGKPILNVLNYSGFGHILIAVVRYFGGIKLGTGGLVRAYGLAAKGVLNRCESELYVSTSSYLITCDFAQESHLRSLLDALEVRIQRWDYSDRVSAAVSLTESQASNLQSRIEASWFDLKSSV